MKKPKQPPSAADRVDENGVSVWDLEWKKCNRCGHVFDSHYYHCCKCGSPEYSLVLRAEFRV